MPFRPINEDHAIQSANFAVTLKRPLQRMTIEQLKTSPAPWRADLPAVDSSQLVDIVPDPATGGPRAAAAPAVEFSFKRPDGSPVWALRMGGTDLVIDTTRYTRWEPTWDKAKSILIAALKRISELDKGRGQSVRSLALIVADVFVSDEESPNFRELFEGTNELPKSILSQGPLWHCHTGWFEKDVLGRVLHNFNLDSRHNISVDPASGSQKRVTEVAITHAQTLQLSPEFALDAIDFSALERDADSAIHRMHQKNKMTIKNIIQAPLRERIGIDA